MLMTTVSATEVKRLQLVIASGRPSVVQQGLDQL